MHYTTITLATHKVNTSGKRCAHPDTLRRAAIKAGVLRRREGYPYEVPVPWVDYVAPIYQRTGSFIERTAPAPQS